MLKDGSVSARLASERRGKFFERRRRMDADAILPRTANRTRAATPSP